jgi:hypothetical protein
VVVGADVDDAVRDRRRGVDRVVGFELPDQLARLPIERPDDTEELLEVPIRRDSADVDAAARDGGRGDDATVPLERPVGGPRRRVQRVQRAVLAPDVDPAVRDRRGGGNRPARPV